jgi:integration host factor subunit beta
MTRAELIEALSADYPDLTKGDLKRVVETIFGEIVGALENGDRVEMRGFGSFNAKFYGARKSRNPRTGETVNVEAKCQVRFKASKLLLGKMNAPGSE